jgi:hypothetical protein
MVYRGGMMMGVDSRMPINNLIDGWSPARFGRVRSLALPYIVNPLTLSGHIANTLTLLPSNEALS